MTSTGNLTLDPEERQKTNIRELILKSLRFPTMKDRYEEVEPAHRNTFKWIFEKPNASHQIWDDFPQWLKHSTGIFWINGKAASGKSTLMRYIHDEPRTRRLLGQWSEDKPLILTSHFFWNSGTADQCSHAGLVRALLFDILKQLPHLVPKVFPDRWNELKKLPLMVGGESKILSWTLPKLSKALRMVFDFAGNNMKFFLLIDGLDEYDGDYPDVINLVCRISTLPNVKVCLSSRPLRDFVVAFKPFPKLRLQDLTYNDIKQYVNDNLGAHPQMQELQQYEPEEAPKLVVEIVEKADGVFLWVTIVVASLLRGLRNSDNISDLQKRLRMLPQSLENLFGHMLSRLEPVYMAQSSRIFQLFSKTREAEDPPTVFTSVELYLAETVDRRAAMQAPTQTLTDDDLAFICDLVETWLQTRCLGLIEVHVTKDHGRHNARLSYLHRTVRDFLELPQIWSQLLQWTISTDLIRSFNVFPSFWAVDGVYNGGSTTFGRQQFCDHHENFLSLSIRSGLYQYVSEKLASNPQTLNDKLGQPFLHYAVALGGVDMQEFPLVVSPSIVALLLELGAQPNEQYTGTSAWEHVLANLSRFRNNPKLEKATLESWMAVVKLFLQNGAGTKQYLENYSNSSVHQLITDSFYQAFPQETKELQGLLVSLELFTVEDRRPFIYVPGLRRKRWMQKLLKTFSHPRRNTV